MQLTPSEIAKIRTYWKGDSSFLGYPDAERDAPTKYGTDTDPQYASRTWLDHLLLRPKWFEPATQQRGAIVIGRKGVGKSAARIAAMAEAQDLPKHIIIEASADELASRHADQLTKAAERGFGAVADWSQIFAELVVRSVAKSLTGSLITSDDDAAVRKWAVIEGVTERDFWERVSSSLAALIPWARKLMDERPASEKREALFDRVARAQSFTLYIDDFDNLQESRRHNNIRLIRDAVEAADRITSDHEGAAIHLMFRQDLWLRLRPKWHYSDKIAGLVELNWTQDDLHEWAHRRLLLAASTALGVAPNRLGPTDHDKLWGVFFPEQVRLRNGKCSSGLHYMVRRTMYTPRGLRQFMLLTLEQCRQFPATLRDVENAEEAFSRDQLEFLKTEFGGLCHGLDVCLQSFTGKTLEMQASELHKHLNGLLGNGQVKLEDGASDGADKYALAKFLFRIGFLETRYHEMDRYEVRDALRYPDHWKSTRTDDSIRWAVRSAFYCALRSHR